MSNNYFGLEGQEVKAVIHSLDGHFDTVKIIEANSANDIKIEYKGKKCTAILNGFNGYIYADDEYGIIKVD